MKKTMLVSSLVLFSTLLGATSVNAGEKGDSATSQGVIKLVVDTGSNTIIDPEDPNQEVTPEKPKDPNKPIGPENPLEPMEPGNPEGGITGNQGPLSIDFVSPFYFGEQAIKATDETYFAKVQNVNVDGKSKEVPNYVQVTDKRGETGGWELTVKQENQFSSEDKKGLAGAALTLAQKGLTSVMPEEVAPTLSNNGAPTALVPAIDENGKPAKEGTEMKLIDLKENTGMGKWVLYFGTDKKPEPEKAKAGDLNLGEKTLYGEKGISLKIPASAVKLKDTVYKTDLTWTLKDVPSNTDPEPEPGTETFDLK